MASHPQRSHCPLNPTHISAYNLVMEEATPFYEWWQAGELHLPSEDTEADMFQYTIETLTAHGYTHYEICNFARPDHYAKHNLVYWNNQPCIGLGALARGDTLTGRVIATFEVSHLTSKNSPNATNPSPTPNT